MIPAEDEPLWFRVMNGLPVVRISFSSVAAHRVRIEDNHCQTLEQLNARGGLDWFELWCGFHDQPLFPSPARARGDMRSDVLEMVQRHAMPWRGEPEAEV